MIVQLRGVSKRFGTHRALVDVDLTVAPGEVVALIGANGAGKSTLIRCLLGLLGPDTGDVRVLGGPPSLATRRRIGYVPQGTGLWPDLTVAEHHELVSDVHGRAPASARTGAAPDDPEVAGARDVLVRDLSLGLRRRLAFALALAHRPDLVVLDEPTSGVDALGRHRAWETITAEAERGAGVLVSTHYLDEAARADRVVLLADGRVVADGTVPDLLAAHAATEVTAPRWQDAWNVLERARLPAIPAGRRLRVPEADADAIRRLLHEAGLEADVATVPATLEELFLVETSR